MITAWTNRIRGWFRRGARLAAAAAKVEPGLAGASSRDKKSRDVQPHRQPRAGKEQPRPPVTAAVPYWDVSQFQVPEAEGKTRFHDLGIPKEIMHIVADLEFRYCTPVQAAVLPKALAGLDATGRAQTGTGKTAAFLITILAHFLRKPVEGRRRRGTPRALILAPTRELALQIEKDAKQLSRYMRCNVIAVVGGIEYEKQKRRLTEEEIDIVVATPGRLLDFKRKGYVHLNSVEILIIDEADRMLDMGFIPDVRRIIESTPPKARRQTMFFSATLTPEVNRLAVQWTREAAIVDIMPEQVAVDSVDQRVYITTADEKLTLLYNMITREKLERVIVFGNRRDETQRLARRLEGLGLSCGLLTGDVEQHQRIKTLENFRSGKIKVLVATDVAARGLHIEGVSHVVNYNLPMDPEDYVHRIGRTGRAGATGTSVSFACEDDSPLIPVIEEFLGRPLSCVYPDEAWLTPVPAVSEGALRAHTHRTPHGGRRRGRPAGPRHRNSSHGSSRHRRT